MIGHVDQEVALAVSNVVSSCNQLRMDLAAADVEVLNTQVHLDNQVAGLDSRAGAAPKRHESLCTVAQALRGNPSSDALATALNNVVVSIAAEMYSSSGQTGHLDAVS